MQFRSLHSMLAAVLWVWSLSTVVAAPVEGSAGESSLQKRENYFTGCTSAQEKIIYTALAWAWSDLFEAKNRISRVTIPTTDPASSAIFEAHFGKINRARLNKVFYNLNITDDHIFRYHYRLDCRCKEDTATIPDVNNAGRIKVCKRWWTAPPRWSTAQGLSQSSLFASDIYRFKYNAGAQDIARGLRGVAALARTSPDKAVNNGDSYALFGERFSV